MTLSCTTAMVSSIGHQTTVNTPWPVKAMSSITEAQTPVTYTGGSAHGLLCMEKCKPLTSRLFPGPHEGLHCP